MYRAAQIGIRTLARNPQDSLGPRPSLHSQKKKKRKESAKEGLVQLIQNNLQSAEFQRVESDWLIGNY